MPITRAIRIKEQGQSEPVHQCGWMGSIPVPSQVDFFCLPFLSPDPSFFFFFGTLFSARPPPGFFFCSSFETFPTLPPTNLLTYIFKLTVDSSPSTYSSINLKCATLIPTHLPTNTLSRYLPNLTYMATPTYMVCHCNGPPTVDNDEERIKWK